MGRREGSYVVYVWVDDDANAVFLSEEDGQLLDRGMDLREVAREGKTHQERQAAGRLDKKIAHRGPPVSLHKQVHDSWESALAHAKRKANEAANSGLGVVGLEILPEGIDPSPHMASRYEDRG